jgi:hypothetical protein
MNETIMYTLNDSCRDQYLVIKDDKLVEILDDAPEGIPVVEIDDWYEHQFDPSRIIEYQYSCKTFFINFPDNESDALGAEVYEADDIYAYIKDYESADDYDEYTLPTLWGLDPQTPDVEEVDSDYQGKVRIWKTSYFLNSGSNDTGWIVDDDYGVKVWDSYAEAEEWIDEIDSGTYYLAHNEADRPSYMICAL